MLISARPLDPDRFADLETVFAGRGCSFARGCWCMAYRESGRPAVPAGATLPAVRKQAMMALAGSAPSPGLIGYDAGDQPIGWVSLGPRDAFARLKRSPVMKPLDDQPVWSVVCFVVPKPCRGQGVAAALLRHGIGFARDHGVRIIEGYPIDQRGRTNDQWLWHGVTSMFTQAGFQEVARRRQHRPFMRLAV